MKYGAKMLQWAPFAETNPEPAGTLPNYGTPLNLGELNKVSDSPVFVEGEAYGDNALGRYVSEFQKVPIDVEILDMTNATASQVLGATLETGDDKNLVFGANDNAPYGGLGFYVNEVLKGNKKVYRGIFYPKVKATMQGEEYSTKGSTIVLTNSKLRFVGVACNSGAWKIQSDNLATEVAAVAWVNNMVKATVGG